MHQRPALHIAAALDVLFRLLLCGVGLGWGGVGGSVLCCVCLSACLSVCQPVCV